MTIKKLGYDRKTGEVVIDSKRFKYKPGIYDHPDRHTVKLLYYAYLKHTSKTLFAEMYYTNNPNYGKSRFGIPVSDLNNFLKGYTKRR